MSTELLNTLLNKRSSYFNRTCTPHPIDKPNPTLSPNPSAYDETVAHHSPVGAAAVLPFSAAATGLALAAAGAVVRLRNLLLGGSGSVLVSDSISSAPSTAVALAIEGFEPA